MYSVNMQDEGFEWLKQKVDQLKRSVYKNAGEYEAEYALMIDALWSAFEGAEFTAPIAKEPPPKKPRAKRTPKSEPLITIKDGCVTHPKYGAQRPPRTDCKGCWAAYKVYHPDRFAKAQRAFERRN